MVQHRSRLTVADNSGAKVLQVIQPLGGSKKRKAALGQRVVAVVKGADSNGQAKDHEVVKAVIVRCRKETRRDDGSYIKFDDNAAVLIDDEGNLRSTRIFGPIAREVRDAGYTKIVSLAQEVW
ncbi:50S ribosomal protein L14 [Candidatus Daviesbacteria bacterium]|nr:50S ribosomal protein L14 [Candidatus Daviesbacteria bacterium]